jgi:hypothetical protein
LDALLRSRQSSSKVLITTKAAKRSAPPRPTKQRRLTGSQLAMQSVSESIQAVAAAFALRNAPLSDGKSTELGLPPSTPQRRTAAVRLLSQYEKALDVQTRSAVLSVFHVNIAAADTYMAIDPDDFNLRRAWIKTMLSEHFPDREFPDLS